MTFETLCDTRLVQEVRSIFVFSFQASLRLKNISFLIWPRRVACQVLVPQPGTEPSPLPWERGVLPAGPPGSPGVPVSLFSCLALCWRIACKACGVFSVVRRTICAWWYAIFIHSAVRMALARPPGRLGRGRGGLLCWAWCLPLRFCHLKAVSVSPLFGSIRVRSHCNIVLNLFLCLLRCKYALHKKVWCYVSAFSNVKFSR